MIQDPNKLIKPYLFGELSGEDLEAFEETFFSDDDLFEQIETAEMRLLDRYVRGEMDKEETLRFESGYLVTPERQKKAAEARIFHRELANIKPEGKGFLAALFEGISFKISVLQFASVATILLICVGILWTLWIMQSNPQPVAETNVQGPLPPIDVNAVPPPSPQDPVESPAPQPSPDSPSVEEPQDMVPPSRDIMPPGGNPPTYATPNVSQINETLTDASSGKADSFKRIQIAEGVQSVRLTIVLPTAPSQDTYSVEVRNAAGEIVLSDSSSRVFGPENRRLVIRTNPGRPFEPGRYEVSVKPSGWTQSLQYGFEIVEDK